MASALLHTKNCLDRASLLTVAGQYITSDWTVKTQTTRISMQKKHITADVERADSLAGHLWATQRLQDSTFCLLGLVRHKLLI